MNICILKGNVGQEPRIHNFDGGGKIATFTLATTERGYKTKDGKEVPERTYWHNIVVRKTGLAGVVEKFVKVGTPVLVSGSYGYRDYTDNDGNEHRIFEVYADELELCGGKKEESAKTESKEDLPPDWLR